MSMYVNVGGVWKESPPKVNVSGTWKDVETGWVNVGGVWKPFFENAGEFQLLGDITVTGSAVTQVDFTGLSLDKDSEYLLVTELTTSLNPYLSVFVNGNVTMANYYNQYIFASGTTVSSARNSQNYYLDTVYSYPRSFSECRIKITNNGYFICWSDTVRAYGTNWGELQKIAMTSTFTISSITSLTIKASSAYGINTGSRFQLYKIGGA